MSNVPTLTLKSRIKSLATEARDIRSVEQHKLSNARKLRGKVMFNKSHPKGEPKPEALVAPQHRLPDNRLELADRDMYDFFGLHRYRTHVLRKKARHTQLAYGFLRGKSYKDIENIPGNEPVNLEVLEEIVLNYSYPKIEDDTDEAINNFLNEFDEWTKDIPTSCYGEFIWTSS